MNADIVTRLRVWSDNAKEQDATEIVVGLCQAADEIERLRKERDDGRQLIGAAADVIERLRKERDQARREVCEFELVNMKGAHEYATHRGWDCYEDKP